MKTSNYLILLVCFAFSLLGKAQKESMKQLMSYKGRKTFVFSYPRSGNTWLRYCLEYLTGRPTFWKNHSLALNKPLAWLADFEIDINKPPIEKMHWLKDFRTYDKENDQLIFLLRNPKETITRNVRYNSRTDKEMTDVVITYEILKDNDYFKNIELFDSWSEQNRLLIYYEDFMNDLEGTLRKIGDFLNEPMLKLDLFLSELEKHRAWMLNRYGQSVTKGKDLLAHSKKIDPEYRKQIDAWIVLLYPELWDKYLKDRFSEEALNQSGAY